MVTAHGREVGIKMRDSAKMKKPVVLKKQHFHCYF